MGRFRRLVILLGLLASPTLATAATCTWTGGGADVNWTTPGNWDACGGAHAVPTNGDSLIFPAGAGHNTSVNDYPALSVFSVQITGLPLSGSAYVIGGGNLLTISGGMLQVNAPPGGTGTGPTFSMPIKLAAALVLSNIGTSDTTIGAIDTNGFNLTLAPFSANITVSGTISGAGQLIKNAARTLILQGNNTFTGALQLNAGATRARSNSALGDVSGGTSVNVGASLVLDNSIATPEPLNLNGGLLSAEAAGDTASGPITLTANSSLFAGGTAILVVSGPIGGAFTLTKLGASAAVLSGSSPAMTGPIVAQTGTLLVDGSLPNSSVSVTGGTLGGSGTIGPILAASGSVSPGTGAGMLTSGDVTMNTSTSLAITLAGTTPGSTYDVLKVNGTVNLANAPLLVGLGLGYTPTQNSSFTIIDNDGTDPVVGTFNGLPEGASLSIGGKPFVISYTGGTGNDVTLSTRIPALYYLSEGATGPFFDTDILLANPNTVDAPVALTFLTPSGTSVVQSRTLAAQSRTTVHVDQIAGLEGTEVSTVVTSTAGLPVVVERSMFWDQTYYGGHTGSSVEAASVDWVFAEGSQGFFNTYVLLANANGTPVDATLTFLREADTPVVKTFTVGPNSRFTVDCATIPEIIDRSFGITVHATQPIIAERAMYFGNTPTRLFSGGHESAGVTAASTSWFLAEGATGGFFDTFVLLSNPQTSDANVIVKFLLDNGDVVTENRIVPAKERVTINIEAEPDPRLANAAVSTVVTSDVPIVAERSMYWIGDLFPWTESHNSFGVVEAGLHWGLAEGRIGGPLKYHTYILLANPQTSAATVNVTFLRESGAPIVKTYTVPPTSRFNIDVNNVDPAMQNEYLGADLKVTNGVPIVVERSLYWDQGGVLFKGGTNATGVRLP